MAVITVTCPLCGDVESYKDEKFKVDREIKSLCTRCRQRTIETRHQPGALPDINWGCRT